MKTVNVSLAALLVLAGAWAAYIGVFWREKMDFYCGHPRVVYSFFFPFGTKGEPGICQIVETRTVVHHGLYIAADLFLLVLVLAVIIGLMERRAKRW